MTTTTIRLPEELKAGVTAAAARTGTTAHAFILEAITEKAANEECRAEFDTEAEARYTRMVASGMAIPWSDMRAYLQERVAAKPATRPVAQAGSLSVARVEIAPEVVEDFEHILDHLATCQVELPERRFDEIIAALDMRRGAHGSGAAAGNRVCPVAAGSASAQEPRSLDPPHFLIDCRRLPATSATSSLAPDRRADFPNCPG